MGLLSEVLMYCLASVLGDGVGGQMPTIWNVGGAEEMPVHLPFGNAWNLPSASSSPFQLPEEKADPLSLPLLKKCSVAAVNT